MYRLVINRCSHTKTETAFESLDAIADDVVTFGMSEVRVARALIGSVEGISARDALHVAVMRKAGTGC